MPVIQPDTSLAEEMSPIEPGTYPARIESCDFQTSKEKNTPMIVPNFVVKVGDKERTRKAYIVIQGKGAWNFDQLLRAVGMGALADAYRDPSAAKPQFDTDSLVGQELNVVVEEEIYNGQKRDRINGYLKK